MARQTSTITVVGKLGNAVGFKRSGSKKAGAKFARIRATDIKNPKTNAQLYQRAVAATVTKAYAAMKEICDHSFEGKAVGAASMQYFNSKNMNLLRKAILADVNGAVEPAAQVGVVVAPKSAFPTPGPYLVSEGSLTQTAFTFKADSGDAITLPTAADAEQTIAQYLAAAGVVANDIFTVVALVALDPQGAFASKYGQLASQPSTAFGFMRLKVKAAALTSTSVATSAKMSDVFDIEFGGQAADNGVANANLSGYVASVQGLISDAAGGFIGCIRSRENSKLRSTCRLQTSDDQQLDATFASSYGIKTDFLLNAWIAEQDTIGQSALILEGGAI